MHKLTAADLELLEKGRYCSIGRQHPRMPLVLVDEAGRTVTEPGERGEIWMLGDCVSLGYLGDEENEGEIDAENGEKSGVDEDDQEKSASVDKHTPGGIKKSQR